jgi:hypothetical protein
MKEFLALVAKLQAQELTQEQFEVEVNKLNYIPYSRFQEKVSEVNGLKEELTARDEQIKGLQKATKGNEELTKQLADIQKQNEEWVSKYQTLQLDTALKLALSDSVDPEAATLLLKRDGLELQEDGTVKGLEDAIKTLQESRPYLFTKVENPTLGGRTPVNPPSPQGGGVKNPWSKEHFNLTEQGKLLQDNPDLAAQYMALAK